MNGDFDKARKGRIEAEMRALLLFRNKDNYFMGVSRGYDKLAAKNVYLYINDTWTVSGVFSVSGVLLMFYTSENLIHILLINRTL